MLIVRYLTEQFAFRNIFIGGFPSFYYPVTANKMELLKIISGMSSRDELESKHRKQNKILNKSSSR